MSKKQSKATREAGSRRAAERAAEVRAQQERDDRRRRNLIIGAAVAGALVIVVALVVALQAGRDTTGESATPPQGAVDTYAIPMGSPDAPVTVTVYEDMMCPFCGVFEQVSADRLKEYAASGDVQVRYHVVSFLDGQSSTDYSTRAAYAVAVVLDTANPEAATAFHNTLFEHQPEEGSAGLSDEQLIDYAVAAGAEEEIAGPIENLRFEQWVVNATGAWSDRGFNGTPTVTVEGEAVEFTDAEELLANTEAAVEAALAEE